ncbi:sugar transferase [Fictibacillus aquaticus]|uniref:Bacterial sugar transferase domain-containing protein n=1 Tax=Fictibacillus aquaticus TaxID=2021314 RepID=A0A235F8Y7_9BACL|nr:sugar transferase [Fictibacillus aquaticus]OYD57722.1 hypothetical protein CGZ90_13745 [Fictibacillus aquaticus]
MGNSLGARMYYVSLALTDMFLVYAGFLAAHYVQQKLELLPDAESLQHLPLQWIAASCILFFYMFDLYSDWRRKSASHLIYLVTLALFLYNMALLAACFWNESAPLLTQQALIIQAFFVQSMLVAASRMSIWYMTKQYFGGKKVLIVADGNADSHILAEKLLQHQKGWYTLSGYFHAAKIRQLKPALGKADTVLVSPHIAEKRKNEIISIASALGKEVLIVPQQYELSIADAALQQISDMPVLSIQPARQGISRKSAKRLFDLTVSAVLLHFSSPIFLLLFVLIPATSKGPALYRQERIGLNGAPYMIYKFRSMRHDAEQMTGPVLASDNDPRITGVGRFIRATRLDELPQLINVLLGDMSIVGPRPERQHFISQFKKQVPNYESRLMVKPGITGLAQVLGNYSTTVEDKLRFDLLYVRRCSLAFDVKIMLQTIRVVLQREQAQGVKMNQETIAENSIQPVLEAKL